MRTLFLALLLANVLFAAYAYWASTEGRSANRPAAQQLAPEKIRIISPDEAARLAAARKSTLACIEWGAFALADAPRATDSLQSLDAGLKVRERRIDAAVRWWVMIPPAPTRAAANQRIAELKNLGADDMFVMDDESGYRNAVSLGLFRNEGGAKSRLDALTRKGVTDARIVARDSTPRIFLQVRDPTEELRTRLNQLKNVFPGTELRECPPENKG